MSGAPGIHAERQSLQLRSSSESVHGSRRQGQYTVLAGVAKPLNAGRASGLWSVAGRAKRRHRAQPVSLTPD